MSAAGTHRTGRVRASSGLVDAATLAAALGVTRGYVYDHADELGVIRLGSGPRARLRFAFDEALGRLASCSGDRESERVVEPDRGGRPRSLGTNVELLPVRGRIVPREAA
jgi:hypothetical protein